MEKSSHKKKVQEMKSDELDRQLKRLEYVLDAPCVKSSRFKFAAIIRTLSMQLNKYRDRLLKECAARAASRVRQAASKVTPAVRYDKAAFILPRRRSSTAASNPHQPFRDVITRINAALSTAGDSD